MTEQMERQMVEYQRLYGETDGRGHSRLPCPRCGNYTMEENNVQSRRVELPVCLGCSMDEVLRESHSTVDPLNQWALFMGQIDFQNCK